MLAFQIASAGFITNGPQCYCGGRDWFAKNDNTWVCSNCSKSRSASPIGYICGGPKCYCGARDWFVGASGARCSQCDKWRDVGNPVLGYIVDGPKCYCGGVDWIVGDGQYRCTNCNKLR